MSFTQDELQALNMLFDQKMTVLRRELERSLDHRMQVLRREAEQRQAAMMQELLRGFMRRLNDQQHRTRDAFYQRFDILRDKLDTVLQSDTNKQEQQPSHQVEDVVERALAAQLLAIEQLINQRQSHQVAEFPLAYNDDGQPDFDAIEVQTEIPWEDLVELIDRSLIDRMADLNMALQERMREQEQVLSTQLQQLRDSVEQHIPYSKPLERADDATQTSRSLTDMREVFTSIEQLERLIESMQVAMTANSALLSNRLYHHQHLPLERAHPSSKSTHASSVDAFVSSNSSQRDAESLPSVQQRDPD